MQRDMELVRDILRSVQQRNDVNARLVRLDGRDELVLDRHVEMLVQAGYLEGIRNRTMKMPVAQYLVSDMTWEGHDFLAALGNETVWGQMKKSLDPSVLATAPLKVVKDIGMELLTTYLKVQLGMGGG